MTLNQSLNLTSNIVNIRTSDDLNNLFLGENYLDTYSYIIMILDQVSSPFNETIVSAIENFIHEGGLYGIISPEIWRFPGALHDLLGLSVSSGPKEWPSGNIAGDITLTIVNETFTRDPFQMSKNSTIELRGNLGITYSLDDSFSIATSQNTPDGKATITGYNKQAGFVFAVPLSLAEFNSSSILYSQFLTSLITSGIKHTIVTQTNSSSQSTFSEMDLFPLFNISEETIQIGIIITSVSLLVVGLAYMISKWDLKPKRIEIPIDRDWFSRFLLTPLLLIGQILYPPVVRRIDEYDVLENPYRTQIIDILEERGFLHFRELKRELDIGTSSLRWHLQVLEDFKIIKRQIYGQYEIFYLLREQPNPDFLEIYFAIISGVGFRVARAFKEMNSWDLNALTEYIGESKESIRYHTKKFQRINLITLKGDRYFLNSAKFKILIEAINRRNKTN